MKITTLLQPFELSKINLFEINFIYIIAGFPVMTTLYSNPTASIGYRAIGALIALWCLMFGRAKYRLPNDYVRLYLYLFILFIARCFYELSLGTYAMTGMSKGKVLGYCYMTGIVLLPLFAFIKGIRKINWQRTLFVLFWLMLFADVVGLRGIAAQVAEEGENARMAMNASQGTLAFGDNGAYLAIISASLLSFWKNYPTKKAQKIWRICYIVGLLVGVACMLKSGSRGPVISGVAALLYILYCATKKTKLVAILVLFFAVLFSPKVMSHLESFAPAFYERSQRTITQHDTSGRDKIFQDALKRIEEHPVLGSSPVLVYNTGIFGFHNVYLTYTIGCGIFIGSIFIVLLIILLWRAIAYHRRWFESYQIFFCALLLFNLVRGITGIMPALNCVFSIAAIGCATMVGSPAQFRKFTSCQSNPQ